MVDSRRHHRVGTVQWVNGVHDPSVGGYAHLVRRRPGVLSIQYRGGHMATATHPGSPAGQCLLVRDEFRPAGGATDWGVVVSVYGAGAMIAIGGAATMVLGLVVASLRAPWSRLPDTSVSQ